jgi:hypothetical protein
MSDSIQMPFKKNPAYKNCNSSAYLDYSYNLFIKPFAYVPYSAKVKTPLKGVVFKL